MELIVGIDPGFSGAISIIDTDGNHKRTFVMPVFEVKKKKMLDAPGIVGFFTKRKDIIKLVMIEKVSAMPRQGVVSMFRFGETFGFLQGVCAALELPMHLVHPATWKKQMCKDIPKGKGSSILIVKRRWPKVNLLPTKRSRKPHDGMADALCIAEYGRLFVMKGI